MMEGRWSNDQIELFYALGKICEKVGKEGADGVFIYWEAYSRALLGLIGV